MPFQLKRMLETLPRKNLLHYTRLLDFHFVSKMNKNDLVKELSKKWSYLLDNLLLIDYKNQKEMKFKLSEKTNERKKITTKMKTWASNTHNNIIDVIFACPDNRGHNAKILVTNCSVNHITGIVLDGDQEPFIPEIGETVHFDYKKTVRRSTNPATRPTYYYKDGFTGYVITPYDHDPVYYSEKSFGNIKICNL